MIAYHCMRRSKSRQFHNGAFFPPIKYIMSLTFNSFKYCNIFNRLIILFIFIDVKDAEFLGLLAAELSTSKHTVGIRYIRGQKENFFL